MGKNEIRSCNVQKEDKEKLIKMLQSRLHWYTFQATEEQFDENEVAALESLLFILDKEAVPRMPDVGQAYERFKEYVALKEGRKSARQ